MYIKFFFILLLYPCCVFADNFVWNKFSYPLEEYSAPKAVAIADVIVLSQRSSGGWGKIIVPAEFVSQDVLIRDSLDASMYDHVDYKSYSHRSTTIDNDATHSHVRYLLRAAKATNNNIYVESALRGVEYLLSAQYPSGGWPQNYPNLSSYGGHVSFNDGAMVGVMNALQEVASGEYGFIDSSLRRDAAQAFWRGVDYILKSQIVVGGVKTAWCAQHDPTTYAPLGGRTYELPSISGAESVGIVRLLMGIPEPTLPIKEAIVAAVSWFEKNKINGFDYIKVYDSRYNEPVVLEYKEDPQAATKRTRSFPGRGYDNVLVPSLGAKPLWARFYDLESQRPFFVGWDGVKKYDVSEIDIERRTGYMWYGRWPESLLNHRWPKWRLQHFK